MYDYLIVGSGLFGSVFAHEMHKKEKSCLVLERRPHVGGNIYCENKDGINIHTYGAHIFHTSNKKVWDYVNQFVEFMMKEGMSMRLFSSPGHIVVAGRLPAPCSTASG